MTSNINNNPIQLPSWPIWGPEEEKALCDTVDEGKWGTLAPRALAFADRFAAFCDCRYGVMTTSGTLSLELALRALGVGHGDEVILPVYTFAATLSSVCIVGATPVLADVELSTCNISAATIRPLITPKTRAILAVHLAGRPCPMDEICALAEEHKLLVIEDCAQAHGARYKGKSVGSFGIAGTFSFQSSKNLTCGEGGGIVTNDYHCFTELWRFHTSGRAYEGSSEFGGRILLGTNARMAEWQAAILDTQMNRFPAQFAKREENAQLLMDLLEPLPFLTLPERPGKDMAHAWHLFTLNLTQEGLERNAFLQKVNELGVPASAGYPYLENLTFLTEYAKSLDPELLPNTRYLNRTAVWLPGYALLAEKGEMHKIAAAFKAAYDSLQ